MKPKLFLLALLSSFAMQAHGAIYIFNNAASGAGTLAIPGDTLYANSNNVYLSGASTILSIGVFSDMYDLNGNLTNKVDLLGNFTTIRSVTIGTTLPTFDPMQAAGTAIYAGYTEYPSFDDASITGTNPLIGKILYAFVGNAATLATATEFALFEVGEIFDDTSAESEYTINPSGLVPLIGTLGTSTVVPGDGLGGGASPVFGTLRTAAIVPEPSSALITMLGVISLLRRKR